MGVDEEIFQLGRIVGNEANGYLTQIAGLKEKIKALPRMHVGPNAAHGISQETSHLEDQIRELEWQFDENKQAMVSLNKGLLPKGGSQRWWAREVSPGVTYQNLYFRAQKLVDPNNSLSGHTPPAWHGSGHSSGFPWT